MEGPTLPAAVLRTVLAVLDEAVIVENLSREIVYANGAAARLLGFEDPDALRAAGVGGVYAAWEMRAEDGGPVDPSTLPITRILEGREAEPVVFQATARDGGACSWWRVKASPVLDDDGRPQLVVGVIEDVTATKRAELEQGFLSHATKLLGASLDPRTTLERIARAAVPDLGDWCAVDMPDRHGVLQRVATADAAPERKRYASLLVQDRSSSPSLPVGPPQVMRTGRSEHYPDVSDDLLRLVAADDRQLEHLRGVGARSALVVPLVARGETTGTITLGTAESGRRLTTDDLALVEELGRRAGTALDNARVHAERSDIAAKLQDALAPPRLPVIGGLAIAARFRAAGEASSVGGDFYDLFGVGDAWIVTMGDVTGKGPGAAATTSLARYTMRTAARYVYTPSEILARLNEALGEDDEERRKLLTAVCAKLRVTSAGVEVTLACAGHPSPLLAGADGSVRGECGSGPLLGAFDDGLWTDAHLLLESGESLVLYTDGVTDTVGDSGGRFGHERLESVLSGLAGRPPDEIAAGLDEALLDFQDGDQRDDVALLVLQAGEGAGGETALMASASIAESAEDAA